jgi:hypothetical protein
MIVLKEKVRKGLGVTISSSLTLEMLTKKLYLGIKTNTEQVMVLIMILLMVTLAADINGDGIDDLTTPFTEDASYRCIRPEFIGLPMELNLPTIN